MMIRTPPQDGRYKGDTFYGNEEDPTAATHEWTGKVWEPLGKAAPISMRPDVRDPAPGSVSQAIPGAEAIPADMPNAEIKPGNMALPYNLQTFNELVAANTAMQTEISSLGEKIALIEQQRDSFATALEHAQGHESRYLTQIADLQKLDREQRAQIRDLNEAHREQSAEKSRLEAEVSRRHAQLQRALGYIDRVHDVERPSEAPMPTSPSTAATRRGPKIEPDGISLGDLWR